MSANILDYFGAQDGIRFGHISFGSKCYRTFHFDRLAKSLRLFVMNASIADALEEDTDPDHHKRALKALLEREPIQ